MRQVRNGYVDTKAGQIHYRITDGTEPPVVFLHQTASSSNSFQELLSRSKLPNRLIALDTPGFGGSFDPPGKPSMRRYGDYLLEALDGLDVGRFHVFGHHTGVSLGAELAMRHAERVTSLMMLGPVPLSEAERVEFRKQFDTPFSPLADGSHLLQNWNYAFSNNPNCDLEIIHREVTNMIRAWKGRAQAYSAVSYQDFPAILAKMRLPMLLMSSTDDYFYPEFAGLCAIRPDIPTALVKGGNFATTLGYADIDRAIAKFFKSFTDRSAALGRPVR